MHKATFSSIMKPWLIWGLSALFVLYQFVLQTSTSVMIPSLMQTFSINSTHIGLLAASFFYIYLLMQVPAGILVDRYGAQRVLTICTFFCGIGCWLFSHAQTIFMAEIGRTIMGLAASPSIAATFYLAAHWFPARRFALLVGLTEMIAMLGGVLGQIFLAKWITYFGWRVVMNDCAFLAMMLAIFIWIIIKESPVAVSVDDRAAPSAIKVFARLACVVRVPAVWLNGLFSGLTFAVVTGFAGLWAVPFLQRLYNVSLPEAAAASSMVFLGVGVSSPIIGWLTGKAERRSYVMLIGAVLGLFLTVVAIYLPGLSFSTMFILLFLLGCNAAVYIAPFTNVQEIVQPAARGTAMGFTNMLCIILGSALLQPLIGYFLQLRSHSTGDAFLPVNFKIAFIVLPIFLLIAILILPAIHRSQRKLAMRSYS